MLRLNDEIETAAKKFELRKLRDLMSRVIGMLGSSGADPSSELRPLLDGSRDWRP